MKKVIQIIPNVGYGDAVGNDTVAITKVLAEMGYETGIYSKAIDKRLNEPLVHDFSKLPKSTLPAFSPKLSTCSITLLKTSGLYCGG